VAAISAVVVMSGDEMLGWMDGWLVGWLCYAVSEAQRRKDSTRTSNKLNIFELRPDMPIWVLGPNPEALRRDTVTSHKLGPKS